MLIFRFELMQDGEQIRKMKQFCGYSRFVFNWALVYQKEQYEATSHSSLATKNANLLPKWKKKFLC